VEVYILSKLLSSLTIFQLSELDFYLKDLVELKS